MESSTLSPPLFITSFLSFTYFPLFILFFLILLSFPTSFIYFITHFLLYFLFFFTFFFFFFPLFFFYFSFFFHSPFSSKSKQTTPSDFSDPHTWTLHIPYTLPKPSHNSKIWAFSWCFWSKACIELKMNKKR